MTSGISTWMLYELEFISVNNNIEELTGTTPLDNKKTDHLVRVV